MSDPEKLIPQHGGYRKLKSFKLAQLAYDLTVRFCDLYIDKKSRTRDQMVQAARSGVQNIADGSQVSGTSKKMEIKLTNVARASLEELRLDYEDFLRQRGMMLLPPDHPALMRFKAKRCSTLAEVQAWGKEEAAGQARTITDKQTPPYPQRTPNPSPKSASQSRSTPSNPASAPVSASPCPSTSPKIAPPRPPELAANAALSLLNLACHLLDRQIAAQEKAFTEEGGFTERLYRVRNQQRKQKEG